MKAQQEGADNQAGLWNGWNRVPFVMPQQLEKGIGRDQLPQEGAGVSEPCCKGSA